MSTPAKTMPSRAAEIVGAANFTDDPREMAAYAVDGVRPSAAARPGTVEEVAELVKLAVAEKLAVIPMGARTKLGIGMPPARYGVAIDMTRLDRVISYDPGDLTLSVEAGIPLAKLAATLAEHQQFVPLAVPFYERATIGGTLASGVDSPLRQMYGTARDFVLGMEFVTGDGALAKSGGRVVKNVSGYDLHKLMLGSIGTLGIMTRLNFKTFPLAAITRTWLAGFTGVADAVAFSQRVRQSALVPRALDILSPWSWMTADSTASETSTPLEGTFARSSSGWWLVAASVSGSEAVMERYSRELWGIAEATHARSLVTLTDGQRDWQWERLRELPQITSGMWHSVTVFKVAVLPSEIGTFLDEAMKIVRASPSTPAVLARASGVIYFAIMPGDVIENVLAKLRDICKRLFELASKTNAPATILWCPLELKHEMNIWGKPGEDFPLMQRVKQAFDPHGILAPGRFVGGL